LIIAGHTDAQGSAQYNLQLSQRRAQSVKDYLVRRGIAARRLIARGYGETYPMAANDTTDGRALNRRSEFIRVDNL
jgi:OOP family OmpA-OmpF porin